VINQPFGGGGLPVGASASSRCLYVPPTISVARQWAQILFESSCSRNPHVTVVILGAPGRPEYMADNVHERMRWAVPGTRRCADGSSKRSEVDVFSRRRTAVPCATDLLGLFARQAFAQPPARKVINDADAFSRTGSLR